MVVYRLQLFLKDRLELVEKQLSSIESTSNRVWDNHSGHLLIEDIIIANNVFSDEIDNFIKFIVVMKK